MKTAAPEFDGLRALITGGASRIGSATALLLARRGARVAVLDRESGVAEPSLRVVADVTDEASVRSGVERAVGELGRLDILDGGQPAPIPDPEAEHEALRARQPIKRLVSAEEVATAIAYLASPLASATTGTELAVDDGMQGLRVRD